MKENKFRFKAVIDFVEIMLKTKKASNGASIKKATGLSFASPIDKGPGGAATQFKIRIQDINKWSVLESSVHHIEKVLDLECKPVITAIEVSFDAYSCGSSENEMLEYIANYSTLLVNPVSINRRFATGLKGSATGLADPVKTLARLKRGGTIYIGDQRVDTHSMRMYYKVTDKNNLLPDEEKRARVEITLTGANCPFRSIEEARNYKFTELSRFFRQRVVKNNLEDLDKFIALKSPHIGQAYKRKRIGGGSRLNSRLTKANLNFNQMVYDQLRQLTKRLNSGKRRILR